MADIVPMAIEDLRNPMPMPVTQANVVLFGERFGHELQPVLWGDKINLGRTSLMLHCANDYKINEFNCITSQKGDGEHNYPWEIANHYGLNWWATMGVHIPKTNFTNESMHILYSALKVLPTPDLRRCFLSLFSERHELPVYYGYRGLSVFGSINHNVQERLFNFKDSLRRRNK